MSKRHEMTDHEYESYRKRHSDDDPLEAEQAKIERERETYARYSRRSLAYLRQQLREIMCAGAPTDEDLELGLPEYEWKAVRELRNARTHRQRLKGLRKHVARREGRDGGRAEP